MSAPLIATCILGDARRDIVLSNCVSGEKTIHTVLAIDPDKPSRLCEEFPDILSPVMWQESRVYLLPLPGSVINPVDEWVSNSQCSKALYPCYAYFQGSDYVWQIMPQGITSEHYHEVEPEAGEICEVIAPMVTDGRTTAWVEGCREPVSFLAPISIRFNQAHQIIREADNFSVHILKMCSKAYRFPDRKGHIKCHRLRKN